MLNRKINLKNRIDIGIKRGVAKALEKHKRLGVPIVISRNGKIVKIPPEEIVIPHYPSDDEIIDD